MKTSFIKKQFAVKVLSTVFVAVLLISSSAWAQLQLLYSTDFQSVPGNPGDPDSWQLRATLLDGSNSQGWFAEPGESTSNQLYADAADPIGYSLVGMSGHIVRKAAPGATYARASHALPEVNTALLEGNTVYLEATIAFRDPTPETAISQNGGFGVTVASTPAAYYGNGAFYEKADVGTIMVGLGNGNTTRNHFIQFNTTYGPYLFWPNSGFNIAPNTVERLRLTLNGATDEVSLERKLYVSGAFEPSWTTVEAPNSSHGLDLSAINVNGLYAELGGNGGDAYYQLDDLSVSAAVPEPATMALLGLGGLVLIRKRK